MRWFERQSKNKRLNKVLMKSKMMNDRYSKMIQVEHDIETMLTCIEELSRAWRFDPVMHEYVQQNRSDIGRAHLLLGLLLGAINASQTTRELTTTQPDLKGLKHARR